MYVTMLNSLWRVYANFVQNAKTNGINPKVEQLEEFEIKFMDKVAQHLGEATAILEAMLQAYVSGEEHLNNVAEKAKASEIISEEQLEQVKQHFGKATTLLNAMRHSTRVLWNSHLATVAKDTKTFGITVEVRDQLEEIVQLLGQISQLLGETSTNIETMMQANPSEARIFALYVYCVSCGVCFVCGRCPWHPSPEACMARLSEEGMLQPVHMVRCWQDTMFCHHSECGSQNPVVCNMNSTITCKKGACEEKWCQRYKKLSLHELVRFHYLHKQGFWGHRPFILPG